MVDKGLVHATPSRYLLNQTNLWAPGSVCKAGLLKHGMHRKNRRQKELQLLRVAYRR